jgi:RHS repeat-associated protein
LHCHAFAGRLIAEATGAGTTVREYVWLDDLPLAVVADVDTMSPNLTFVHADHLDRPLKMTDATQAIVWDAVYRPFGEVHAITGAAANNLRFPGQYFLIESGLHYNWHRHYDPTLGRYIQADPLGFVDGPSVYGYAKSTPVMEIDSNGLQMSIWRRGTPMTPVPSIPIPKIPEWWKLFGQVAQICARIATTELGGGGDRCLDRWEREHGRCSMFRPYGFRYQLACEARANDRLRLCIRNGGKPAPNEPPEYDWQDIPRDAPRRR